MVVAESVAAEAVLEPEMAPNPAPASAVEMASPAGVRPTQVFALSNSSLAMRLTIMNSAIKMNMGMVNSS